MTGMRAGSVVLVLLAALAVAGCSNADEPAVREAASSFASGDAQLRCDLLAPATAASLLAEEGSSCTQAIGQLPLGGGGVVSVEVWGEDALVHLADDTLFLTRDDGAWLVSAAACEPAGEGPYQCQLEAS
jgi:hypothetical protein